MKIAINQTNRTLPINLAPVVTEAGVEHSSVYLLPSGCRNAAGELRDRCAVTPEDMLALVDQEACGAIIFADPSDQPTQPVAATPTADVASAEPVTRS